MAAQLKLDSISKVLECAVCLETVCNPKKLICNHAYCKHCLDGLLQFQDGGAATIKCPKGCNELTSIPSDGTTNDLEVNFMIKGILEMVQNDIVEKNCDTKSRACDKMNCNKPVSFYCLKCLCFTCGSCYCHEVNESLDKHEHNIFISVLYDTDSEEIKVICKEHSTNASYLCIGHPCAHKFLCRYCVHRGHSQHQFESFVNVEHNVKELVQQHIRKLNDLELPLRQVEINISEARNVLSETLEGRKVACLSEYLLFLNSEAERQMKSFNVKAVLQGSCGSYDNVKNSIQHYQCIPSKEAMDIILQRHRIVSDIQTYDYRIQNNISVDSLSLSEHSFKSSKPLGELSTVTGESDSAGVIKLSDTSNDRSVNSGKYICMHDKINKSFPNYKETEATMHHQIPDLLRTLVEENENLGASLSEQKKENERISSELAEQKKQNDEANHHQIQTQIAERLDSIKQSVNMNKEIAVGEAKYQRLLTYCKQIKSKLAQSPNKRPSTGDIRLGTNVCANKRPSTIEVRLGTNVCGKRKKGESSNNKKAPNKFVKNQKTPREQER